MVGGSLVYLLGISWASLSQLANLSTHCGHSRCPSDNPSVQGLVCTVVSISLHNVSSTVIGRKLKMYDVIISVLASQVVGALWYSPLFVGVPWSCLAFPGCNEKEIQTLLSVKTNYAYGVAFSSAVFLTLLLKFFFLTYVS